MRRLSLLAAAASLWACSGADRTPGETLSNPGETLSPRQGESLPPPLVEDFAGRAGGLPDGWVVQGGEFDWAIASGTDCRGGTSCLASSIYSDHHEVESAIRLEIDARPYRGSRVELVGHTRSDVTRPPGLAWLDLSITSSSGELTYDDRAQSEKRASESWVRLVTATDVAGDAESIVLELSVRGISGTFWFDDLRLEAVGPAGAGDAPPTPLSARELDSVVALARLYGYVRYFHPSSQAEAIDWTSFLLWSLPRVEGVTNAAELRATLDELFAPIAPTVQVFDPASTPSLPAALSATDSATRTVRWYHYGLGGDPGLVAYRSKRRDPREEYAEKPALLFRQEGLQLEPGDELDLSALVRSSCPPRFCAVSLFADTVKDGELEELARRDISPNESWSTISMSHEVSQVSSPLFVGLELEGPGTLGLDDLEIRVNREPVFEDDFDGQRPDAPPSGLRFGDSVDTSGLSVLVTDAQCPAGNCVRMIRSVPDDPRVPSDPYVTRLSSEVAVSVPVALFATDAGTLPAAELATPWEVGARVRDADDRTVRLATVIIAWNVIQHFYPYRDSISWQQDVLASALREAANDEGGLDFLGTLRSMLAKTRDGHLYVRHPAAPRTHEPDFLWKWLQDELVVIQADDETGLHPGDRVVEIRGKPVLEVLRAEEALTPASRAPHRRYRALENIRSGPPDSVIELTVLSPGGSERSVRVPRATEGSIGSRRRPTRPDSFSELAPGIIYVDLHRATEAAFAAHLDDLQNADGLVFDMRGYPGPAAFDIVAHLIEEPRESPSLLAPTPRFPDQVHLTFREVQWQLQPKQPFLSARSVFLIDETAQSASETLLSFVEAYELAELLGTRTAGINGSVNYLFLPGGYQVRWTGQKVLRQDGSKHFGVGIVPTVPVQQTGDDVRKQHDPHVAKAVQLLQKRITSQGPVDEPVPGY